MSERKTTSQDGEDKHLAFTQWARDRGVTINGVEPEALAGRGVGLVATKPIKEGERILSIPEKAMFKPDLALLKREGLEHASPQAQLAISAMAAFKDEKSMFKVWEKTWPTAQDFTESMPLFWPVADRQHLPPTVHQPFERQLADYAKDCTGTRDFCSRAGFSEEDFRYYWMIVNSRSFHWKSPRGQAGCMVMCPFIDYLNHGPTGSTCKVTISREGYYVTADRAYAPGEEILATYGPHNNDKLLLHYGFILPSLPSQPNPDDSIPLDHLILPSLPSPITSQLQDIGFLGGYALLPAKNEICFRTQVAVRAMLLTCNEWEYFVACGEDLAEDCEGRVGEFVRRLFETWRGEVEKYCNLPGTVGQRWRQIMEATDAYCSA